MPATVPLPLMMSELTYATVDILDEEPERLGTVDFSDLRRVVSQHAKPVTPTSCALQCMKNRKWNVSQVEIARRTIREFCLEFIENPYLCYTEHGLHALFYTKLFNAFTEEERYTNWLGNRVCVIQKEYPTAGNLGKPRRQHWDISIIKNPPESKYSDLPSSYDYLKLAAVVEFGMNES